MKNNKTIIIVICFIIFSFLVLGIYGLILKKNRVNKEVETNYYLFKLDNQTFEIGLSVSEILKKGYSIDNTSLHKEELEYGEIMPILIKKNDDAQLYGLVYCDKEKCNDSNNKLIKMNFYNNSNVELLGNITYGTEKEKTLEQLGKQDGKFYLDSNYLAWAFYDKGTIGTPYYILEFADGKVSDIRIGLWWYEDEYEYTITK